MPSDLHGLANPPSYMSEGLVQTSACVTANLSRAGHTGMVTGWTPVLPCEPWHCVMCQRNSQAALVGKAATSG